VSKTVRRDAAAKIAIDAVDDHPMPDEMLGVVAAVGARFYLNCYDAGIDLDDPHDARAVCAVLTALGSTSSRLQLGYGAALSTAVAHYRSGR
jgi:hypothetical protein